MRAKRGSAGLLLGGLVLTISLLLAPMVVSFGQHTSKDPSRSYVELGLPKLFADYASFKAKTIDKVKLEIYYKIFPKSLQFQRFRQGYKASYELVMVIYDGKGRQVTGRTFPGSFTVDTYRETENIKSFTTDQTEFELYSGNYKAELKLTDLISGKSTKVELDIDLSHFGYGAFALSEVEFAQELDDSSGGVQFNKEEWRVIPSVSRAYGEDFPKLIFYYEIYLPSGELPPLEVAYQIRKRGGKEVVSETNSLDPSGEVTPVLHRLDVSRLAPGGYILKVIATRTDKRESVAGEFPFSISWSALTAVKNDYQTAVEQLRYVATENEMETLRGLKGEGERIKEWNRFWKSRDPTPGTPENELRDEYYSRIRYADMTFSYLGREGWRTDFGMVYITYGPPDEIDRHPFDLDRRAYQVWYYYTLKKRFVFVDAGYGEYRLQYPYDGDMRKYR